MNHELLFSVVIPTCNRLEMLVKCLDRLGLGMQSLAANQYEVIVTDDGSQSTAEQLMKERYPWVRWVQGPRKGPATNRNNGARYAEGEWLVFTDDDCIPDPEWLSSFQKAVQANPSYQVFEGRTYVARPRMRLDETSPINEAGGYLWSCNMMIHKKLFDSMQGFDERFSFPPSMEDPEFRLRLRNAGHSFLFVPRAAVCHPWRRAGGWPELRRHDAATFLYLSLHPQERARINGKFYLRVAARELVFSTLPGLFKYRARGLGYSVIYIFHSIQMACRLFISRLK